MTRTLLKLFLFPLLTAVHVAAAAAPCAAELGPERAAQLVKQCLTVAPAMRPACNAANSCQRIEETIQSGCAEKTRPAAFCFAEATKGTHEGYLVGGGGSDFTSISIRRDDGKRFSVYCGMQCEAWYDFNSETDREDLKPAYLGKRVSVTVQPERNGERLPGADKNDVMMFVKSIRLLK